MFVLFRSIDSCTLCHVNILCFLGAWSYDVVLSQKLLNVIYYSIYVSAVMTKTLLIPSINAVLKVSYDYSVDRLN